MQFIPIVPIPHLRYSDNHYVLSLANLYGQRSYQRFFKRMHLQGHWVIMDNAAYELPKPLSIEALWELVVFWGASELVLPDVISLDRC